MKKVRLLILALAVVLAVALVLPACAPKAAGPALNFKVSHQWAEGDVRDRLARAFGDMVTERTNGDITFTYYPARALFQPKEQWDAMRIGALDLSVFPLDYASGKVPEFDITLMPCAIPSMEIANQWRHKAIGTKIEEIMLENDVKMVIWAWCDGGFGSKVEPIILPEDVKGRKMRAAGRRFEYMRKEAGAAITSMPSSELYQALATGVLDAAMTSSASWVSYKLYEQVDYQNIPRDYCVWFMSEPLVIGTKAYNKMSAGQQRIFDECADEMMDNWVPPEFGADTAKQIEAFTKAGVDIHYMTKAEWDAWLELAKTTSWVSYGAESPRCQELLDLALAAGK